MILYTDHHPGLIGIFYSGEGGKKPHSSADDAHLSPSINCCICPVFIIYATEVLYKELLCKDKFFEN